MLTDWRRSEVQQLTPQNRTTWVALARIPYWPLRQLMLPFGLKFIIQSLLVNSLFKSSSFAAVFVFVCCCCSFYSAPVGVRSIVINPSVCLSVCVSASVSLELLDRSSRNFVYRSPVAVARSSSGGVALCYILPVLWMTPRLAVMGALALRGRPDLLLAVSYVRDRGGVWCLWMRVIWYA